MKWYKSAHIESSDENLLSQYRLTGEMDYVSDLYSKYVELVFGLCLKYLHDEEKSKDAVMDIYELVVKKVQEHEVDHFKSWLYIVSKNHCLGVLRKKKKELDKKDSYAKINGHAVFHPFQEDLKEAQLQQLESCIEHLIDTQQTCIKMFYLDKNSYKEIANQLQMSWSRIRSLIQNGRRNLKICIEQS